MPYPKVSPYDILEVSLTANQKEIIAAYQIAVRKKRFPAPVIAQAFNDLRNNRKRSEHDLLTMGYIARVGDIMETSATREPDRFVLDALTTDVRNFARVDFSGLDVGADYCSIDPYNTSFSVDRPPGL